MRTVRNTLLLSLLFLVGCKSTSHQLLLVGEVTTGRIVPAFIAGPEVHTVFVLRHEKVAELPSEEEE